MWSLAIITLPAGMLGEYTLLTIFENVNKMVEVIGISYTLKESMEILR
jgi:hypothetical protein